MSNHTVMAKFKVKESKNLEGRGRPATIAPTTAPTTAARLLLARGHIGALRTDPSYDA